LQAVKYRNINNNNNNTDGCTRVERNRINNMTESRDWNLRWITERNMFRTFGAARGKTYIIKMFGNEKNGEENLHAVNG